MKLLGKSLSFTLKNASKGVDRMRYKPTEDFYDAIEELEKYTEELKEYIENMIEKYEKAKTNKQRERLRNKVEYFLLKLPFDF